MERRGSKSILTGPRARVAEVAIFMAGISAACQPGAVAETPKPTVIPTEQPAPTLTASPLASAEASPTPVITPAPEVTPTPEPTPNMPTAMEISEQIINQPKSDIDKTSINSVSNKINKIWDEYGDILKTIELDGENLSRSRMLAYIDFMKKGKTVNGPARQITEERARYSAGLSALELAAYNNVEDEKLKLALAEAADDNYDYAMTSISSNSSEVSKIKKSFAKDMPYILEFYLNP